MKLKTHPLPLNASSYIQDHFREDFLFEVKEVKVINGQLNYFVEVTKDDYIHSLRFNEQGNLVEGKVDEAFPSDIHEQPLLGDVPE